MGEVTLKQVSKSFSDFEKSCNDNIKTIMENNIDWNITPNKDKNGFYISRFTDNHLEIRKKYNFLWFNEIKRLYKNRKYFWLDADGEICKTDEEGSCNLYVDREGYLNFTIIKDTDCHYRDCFKTRIDCYYNDIVYQRRMLKRDKKIMENHIKSI